MQKRFTEYWTAPRNKRELLVGELPRRLQSRPLA